MAIKKANEKQIKLLESLLRKSKYELTAAEDELTAKLVYILTNHLLNKESNLEVANKYLKDTMNNTLDNNMIAEEDFISNLNIPEEE